MRRDGLAFANATFSIRGHFGARVQRIPQESNYFVFRQLKISCREGGGSTTGE